MSSAEFSEYCKLNRKLITLDSTLTPTQQFDQMDINHNGYIDEKEFCLAMNNRNIKICPTMSTILSERTLSESQIKWKKFVNILIWYLTLPISLHLAPNKVKSNIDKCVALISEIDSQSNEYRDLKNAWTAFQIQIHGNWDEKHDPDSSVMQESALLLEMSKIEARIALLRENLDAVKKTASPGAFNVLEFFVHNLPMSLSDMVDGTISSEHPSWIKYFVVHILIFIFTFAVVLVPIGIIIIYNIYDLADMKRSSFAEVYMPLLLFVMIVLMQAGQDAMSHLNEDEVETKENDNRHDLSLAAVKCSEGMADTAEDIYDWVKFIAFKEYSIAEILLDKYSPFKKQPDADSSSSLQKILVGCLALVHGCVPIITRWYKAESIWVNSAIPYNIIIIGNIVSSTTLFWLVIEYLRIGYYIYASRLKVLRTFTFVGDLKASKRIGLPFLSLEYLSNILAWSRVRHFFYAMAIGNING